MIHFLKKITPLTFRTGFELVDVSTSLPTLQRCPGMTAWVPTTDRNLMFHDTYEAYIASIPEAKRKEAKMGKSHWPPPAEEVKGLHLDRWYAVVCYSEIGAMLMETVPVACAYIRTCRIRAVFLSRCCSGRAPARLRLRLPAGAFGILDQKRAGVYVRGFFFCLW